MSKQRWSGVLIGLALSLLLLGACATTAAPAAVSSPAPTPPAPTPQVLGEVSTFSAEGVQVTVPSQARSVHVVKLDLVPVPSTPTQDGFEPFRPVINLDVQYEDGTSVEEFNPPIEISVRYTTADFDKGAQGGKTLRLGFWDGKTWRPYTVEKHSFQLVPDGKEPSGGGWGVVLVSDWGDPTDAWGR